MEEHFEPTVKVNLEMSGESISPAWKRLWDRLLAGSGNEAETHKSINESQTMTDNSREGKK